MFGDSPGEQQVIQLGRIGLALGGLVTVVVPLALFWAMLGLWLGRAQQRKASANAAPEGPPASAPISRAPG